MDTRYQWTKQVACNWGGIGRIVDWPKGVDSKSERRWQFHHVIDLAPTILEAAGLPEPTFVNAVEQHPIEGVSMPYSSMMPKPGGATRNPILETLGNRGIYHKGWTAVTRNKTPCLLMGEKTPAFDERPFKVVPGKTLPTAELVSIEATKYNISALNDDTARLKLGSGGQVNADQGQVSRFLNTWPAATFKLFSFVLQMHQPARVTIKTGVVNADGCEEELIEFVCDFPGCPNIVSHVLARVPISDSSPWCAPNISLPEGGSLVKIDD